MLVWLCNYDINTEKASRALTQPNSSRCMTAAVAKGEQNSALLCLGWVMGEYTKRTSLLVVRATGLYYMACGFRVQGGSRSLRGITMDIHGN